VVCEVVCVVREIVRCKIWWGVRYFDRDALLRLTIPNGERTRKCCQAPKGALGGRAGQIKIGK
jgi:hypothetical protein